MRTSLIGTTLIAAVVAGTAFAGGHSGNPAVKARQAHMQLYQFNLGYLGGAAQGKVDYDAQTAQNAANNLVALMKMDQSRMWAPGTDNMSIDGTRALPALWENFPNVMEISGGMVAAAENLAAVAGDGKDAMAAALGGVGQACGACHKAYRAPNN